MATTQSTLSQKGSHAMIIHTLDCCPRQDCGGFVVQEILYNGAGWSNFNVVVYKCMLCARYFEGAKEYGVEVGRLADGKCYGARQGVNRDCFGDE